MEKKWVSKQLCWEKGQALVFAAVLMGAAVMGFILVSGGGQIVLAKNELQSAADSAALAGGFAMGNGKTDAEIRQQAIDYAQKEPGRTSDTVETPEILLSPDTGKEYRVKVTMRRSVSLPVGTYTISASATAEVSNAGSITNPPPYIIEKPKNLTWNGNHTAHTYAMTMNPTDQYSFGYGDVIYKDSMSWDDYMNFSQYGAGQDVECTLDTDMNYTGPSEGGQQAIDRLKSRLAAGISEGETIDNIHLNDKRLLVYPMVESLPSDEHGFEGYWGVSGWRKIKPSGFVGFWIDHIEYATNRDVAYKWIPYYNQNGTVQQWVKVAYYPNYRVVGYFVKLTLPLGRYSGTGSEFFGTSQVRLVE